MAQLLIDRGADPCLADDNGIKPIEKLTSALTTNAANQIAQLKQNYADTDGNRNMLDKVSASAPRFASPTRDAVFKPAVRWRKNKNADTKNFSGTAKFETQLLVYDFEEIFKI